MSEYYPEGTLSTGVNHPNSPYFEVELKDIHNSDFIPKVVAAVNELSPYPLSDKPFIDHASVESVLVQYEIEEDDEDYDEWAQVVIEQHITNNGLTALNPSRTTVDVYQGGNCVGVIKEPNNYDIGFLQREHSGLIQQETLMLINAYIESVAGAFEG